MRVTFLGTGTSSGVPVVGCDCATCCSDDPRDRRWRPSIYLELADRTRVLVDTSPDLRSQALAFGVTGLDVILFTHHHADHVMGLDDVRAFNYRQRGRSRVWVMSRRWRRCGGCSATCGTRRPPRGGGLPRLRLVEVTGRFCLGRSEVVPVPIYHGTQPILGYRVDAFAYLTDCSAIPETSWALLEGVEVVVLDALRHRPHPTHFTVTEAVEVAARIGARQTYFTHMCHDLPHAKTCAALPAGVTLAHDGLVVEL